MSGEVVSIDEVIDKTLFALKDVSIKRNPDENSVTVRTVHKGEKVGVVYSYVERDGYLWWILNPESTEFVLHAEGSFDLEALKEQGTQTDAEKQRKAELESAGFFDKLFLQAKYAYTDSKALRIGTYIFIILIVLLIGTKIYKNVKSK
jgi:hypothetical protein